MKEINIAKTIISKRKEKVSHKRSLRIVSSAAVFKWENGLTYPDITLLPQLATYFK